MTFLPLTRPTIDEETVADVAEGLRSGGMGLCPSGRLGGWLLLWPGDLRPVMRLEGRLVAVNQSAVTADSRSTEFVFSCGMSTAFRRSRFPGRWLVGYALLVWASALGTNAADLPAATAPRYETRARPDRDGIGKIYCGREIAQVMGHQAAGWLERPEREEEERTDLLLDALGLKPGDVVADIGAGTGYFSWRMAQAVGKHGKVYAEDIQQEMLDMLTARMRQHQVDDIVTATLGTTQDPRLPPAALDLILLVDVYHELDFPFEMTQAMVRALKPGGRLVLVEYRGEDPAVAIKPLHKMTVAQVRKELLAQSLVFDRVIETLPLQHILVFKKTG